MDPLTITLAVVTFTTALKDIIELSQKIKQSFSKVSSTLFVTLDALISCLHGVGITKHGECPETGRWGTSRLAPSARILRRKFCNFEHFQWNAGSAGKSNEVSPVWNQLYRLYGAHCWLERWKFQSKNAMTLIPLLAERMIGRLKVAVYAWRHCNEIEATLLKLRDHIRACHQWFMVSCRPRVHTITG